MTTVAQVDDRTDVASVDIKTDGREIPERFEATACDAWQDLEAKLRHFIAKHLRSRADVDDVFQDVFLRMQRGLPSLRDEQRFGPWMYQIARSAIAGHLLQASRHPIPDTAALAEPTLEFEEEDESALQRALATRVAVLVGKLPSPYREALTLTDLEGLTQKEAADKLGISFSGMKSRVQRGRSRLRDAFNACCKIVLDVRGRVISCEPRPEGRPAKAGCGYEDESPHLLGDGMDGTAFIDRGSVCQRE